MDGQGNLLKALGEPVEIAYRRWKHKEHGYTAEVLGVHHYPGEHGYYTTVTVKGTLRSKVKQAVWSASRFLTEFKPRGKKIKAVSQWDRLLSGPLSSI